MTYQDSKKVKIIKKKHPEVRKAAEEGIEDILRKSGSSVDGEHHDSSFLSSKGDFIGGGDTHEQQIGAIQGGIGGDEATDSFIQEHGIPRVQRFAINRAGESKLNFSC